MPLCRKQPSTHQRKQEVQNFILQVEILGVENSGAANWIPAGEVRQHSLSFVSPPCFVKTGSIFLIRMR
jgi:hypothetical protein